ncbi:MAG: hypothetical protein ACRC5G_01000 [Cetobacterium sp.]
MNFEVGEDFFIDSVIESDDQEIAQEEVISDPFIDTDETLETESQEIVNEKNLDESKEDSTNEEEEEKIDQEELETISNNEQLELQALISSAKYIAERKGVLDNIDFSNIQNADEVADLLDSFDDLDEAVAFEKVKQSDATIGKIIDYISSTGKTDGILNFLTNSKQIASLDITTESGARSLIESYYTDVVKYNEDLVSKKIKSLEAKDSLMEEAEDLKPLYQEHLDKELERKRLSAEQEKTIELQELKKKETAFINVLKENKYQQQEAVELYNTAFKRIVYPDGTKKFLIDAKIEKLKENPESFLNLTEFILDPKKYQEKIISRKGSEITAKNLNKRLSIAPKVLNKVQQSTSKETSRLTFN